MFPVLSSVTVGHWVIGRPRNKSVGGLLELPLCRSLEFLVLALPIVHSPHLQQGRGLRVLGTKCPLHESEFRLFPEVVSDWFPQFANWLCALLADSWLRRLALRRTFDCGWLGSPVSRCLFRFACFLIIPQPPYAAGCTVSVGFILTPLPYRMVNAGHVIIKIKK